MGKSSCRGGITLNVIALALGFGLSACGGDADGYAAQPGSATEEIVNGESVNPLGSGIVYVMTPKGNCSGVLMKNRAFMTAKHCVVDYVNSPGQVTGFMHPWAAPADGIWVHGEKDVAVVRMSSAFPFYAPNQARPIYMGSTASLHNKTLMLAGYGWTNGCTGQSPFSLRRAFMTAHDNAFPGQVITVPNSLGQIGFEGDSGAPLLDGNSLQLSPVAAIQTDCSLWACPNDPPNLCMYDTAEAWGLWAFLILFNIPN